MTVSLRSVVDEGPDSPTPVIRVINDLMLIEFVKIIICTPRYKERPGLPPPREEQPPAVSLDKSHGPATDRLASLKAAFRSQYNQVLGFVNIMLLHIDCCRKIVLELYINSAG